MPFLWWGQWSTPQVSPQTLPETTTTPVQQAATISSPADQQAQPQSQASAPLTSTEATESTPRETTPQTPDPSAVTTTPPVNDTPSPTPVGQQTEQQTGQKTGETQQAQPKNTPFDSISQALTSWAAILQTQATQALDDAKKTAQEISHFVPPAPSAYAATAHTNTETPNTANWSTEAETTASTQDTWEEKAKGETKKAPDKASVWAFDSLIKGIFGWGWSTSSWEKAKSDKKGPIENNDIVNKELKEQVKYLLNLPDEEYDDKKLTNKLRKYILDADHRVSSAMSDYKSHIAPSYREANGSQANISGLFARNYYVQSYPSYMEALWTRDLMWFSGKRDMSFFVYPEDDSAIQSMLKTKATQLKAEINENLRKGITVDTELEVSYRDIETIRQKLATREERYFETGFYTTLYHEKLEKLTEMGKKFEQKIAWVWVKVKPSSHRMDEWLETSIPLCRDELGITRSTITSSLAWSFPFVSSDMISQTGILYGVNMHTWSLVVFDRFNSTLPNMNSVILATSWAGKSFSVKLEILRYLLNGIDVIVIDPENEYKGLIDNVWGTYVNIATSSNQFINPFDLPPKIEDREYGKWDLLRSQIMDLIWLLSLLLWWFSPQEEAIMDKALQTTYSLAGISVDDDNNEGKEAPLMEDLLHVLEGMDGAEDLAIKLSKYVTWTFGKIFNNRTNVDINNQLTVFSIRDLEDALKTPAMYNTLNFIWTKVRSQKKKRLLVCDEAWIMLQNDISANFLFGLIKRARKYGLGITTISQDIEDFMRSKYGKPIVSNSSLQLLLKQSTTSIKALDQLLWLSEAEKQRLVASGVWEWVMFAGQQHIALKILASPQEKEFITTDIAHTWGD